MNGVLVDMQHIKKSYKGSYAILQDASLTVRRGELCMIRGQSGAGKSTLLNILGLLDAADAGSYTLGGVSVLPGTSRRRAQLRSRMIGFVFQSYHLLESLSVEDNVLLPYLYTRAPLNAGARQRMQVVLQDLDLVGLGHRPVRLLSGGERQRVAIARAVIREPELVIADEPTGNLDQDNSARVMGHLLTLSRSGTAVVVVTHNDSLLAHADTSYSIVDGMLVDDANA